LTSFNTLFALFRACCVVVKFHSSHSFALSQVLTSFNSPFTLFRACRVVVEFHSSHSFAPHFRNILRKFDRFAAFKSSFASCCAFGLHTFIVSFILAALSKPILGIDFLSAHRLLIDPFSRAMLFASSLQPVGCTAAAATSKFAASISHIVPAVRSLLASFPSIDADGKGTPRPRHGVRHYVETSGRPVFAKACRLDPDKLKIAEAEFRSLEAAGIVHGPTLHGPSPFTWSPRRMGHGGPAATIAASTPSPLKTITPFPPC
jgi:hypothetical protein